MVGGHSPHDPPCQALVSPKASHVGMLTTTSEGWERESVGWLFWKCDLDTSRPHMWGFKTSQRRENNFIEFQGWLEVGPSSFCGEAIHAHLVISWVVVSPSFLPRPFHIYS